MGRITVLVHRGKGYTVAKYLRSWGRDLGDRLCVKTYPGLLDARRRPVRSLLERLQASWARGTLGRQPPASQLYFFGDIERLSTGERSRAAALRQHLLEHPATAAILNHPTASMRRYALLRTLHQRGFNRFAVYPLDDSARPSRWPVFVRSRSGHGDAPHLLSSPDDLARERARVVGSGIDPRTMMVVEFCDTSDRHGLFRKYGAFRVGSRIVARQIHFSRRWRLRVPDVRIPATGAEELRYVEENPHADSLLPIFELAGIEYGRIDYSLLDGEIQTWEINTNPGIMVEADRHDPLRRAAHEAFSAHFRSALDELLEGATGGPTGRSLQIS